MNIDKLKSVIQKANPEIMELKFGCEVFARDGLFKKERVVFESNEGWVRTDCHDRVYSYEILGRPIRLADVLVAIKFGVSRYGDNKNEISDESASLFEYWNLLNDNLDHQTNECKQFLTDLLVGKEMK